ncbi:MAG: hypothetical protein ACYCSN_18355 [Acidobacteriaceae bacterium]
MFRKPAVPQVELDSWIRGFLDASDGIPCNPPHHLHAFSYATGYIEGKAHPAELSKRPLRIAATDRHPTLYL